MTDLDSVLVTGGGGFVGSHAAEFYAERGCEVTVLDNRSRADTLEHADDSRGPSEYNWRYLEREYPEIDLVEGDIRDSTLVEKLVEGQDGVIHAAGQVAVTSSLEDPRTDFEVNALGSFNVLEAARRAENSPAVALASTNKIYGDNINDIPVREEETRYQYDDSRYDEGIPESFPIDGCEHTPYGVSKLAADLYFQDYAKRGVVDAAAFRMSCIYGPRQFGNEDQGWVAHFALSALRDKPLTVFGDGKQVRDVLYVKDLIRAYDAFLSDPEGKPALINVGGGPENTTSLLEFLNLLEKEVGRPEVTFDKWREGDQRVYVSDVTRAQQSLDWAPKTGFSEGMRKFLNWNRRRTH